MVSFIPGASGFDAPQTGTMYQFFTSVQRTNYQPLETSRRQTIPVAVTLSDFYLYIGTAPGVGSSLVFTIMQNGVATGLTLTIADNATSGSITGTSVNFAAGDTISLQCTANGTPALSSVHQWFVKTTGANAVMLGGNTQAPSGTATSYSNIIGCKGDPWTATEADIQVIVPTAGTLRNLWVKQATAPGGAASYTYTVMQNGAASSLAAAISGTNTSASDTADTVTVAAGDTLSLRSVPASAPAAAGTQSWGFEFVPTNNGETWLGVGFPSAVALSQTAVEYSYPLATGATGWAPLADQALYIIRTPACTAKKVYIKFGTAPGGVASRTITLQRNLADTNLSAVVTGTATTANGAFDVAVSLGDSLAYSDAPAGTPAAASRFNAGLLLLVDQPVSTPTFIKPPTIMVTR